MDIKTVLDIITTVGFPIACCIILFIQNNKMSETLNKLSETLSLMNDRILDIERKLDK